MQPANGDANESQSEHDDTASNPEGPAATTRRGILSTGMKLALAAPVGLIALQGGVALAKPRTDRQDDNDPNPPGPAHPGRGRGNGPPWLRPLEWVASTQRLCRVSDVKSGADFTPTNGGSDPLSAGVLHVTRGNNDQAGRIWVDLRGASANTAYEVYFAHYNDHGRENIGGFATGSNGNFRGFASGTLGQGNGGTDRVGVFVIQNGSSDEFVSCFMV